jgi:hypothetical protein
MEKPNIGRAVIHTTALVGIPGILPLHHIEEKTVYVARFMGSKEFPGDPLLRVPDTLTKFEEKLVIGMQDDFLYYYISTDSNFKEAFNVANKPCDYIEVSVPSDVVQRLVSLGGHWDEDGDLTLKLREKVIAEYVPKGAYIRRRPICPRRRVCSRPCE